jgi:hypothetical protein
MAPLALENLHHCEKGPFVLCRPRIHKIFGTTSNFQWIQLVGKCVCHTLLFSTDFFTNR